MEPVGGFSYDPIPSSLATCDTKHKPLKYTNTHPPPLLTILPAPVNTRMRGVQYVVVFIPPVHTLCNNPCSFTCSLLANFLPLFPVCISPILWAKKQEPGEETMVLPLACTGATGGRMEVRLARLHHWKGSGKF